MSLSAAWPVSEQIPQEFEVPFSLLHEKDAIPIESHSKAGALRDAKILKIDILWYLQSLPFCA